jgi:hypothetical protein
METFMMHRKGQLSDSQKRIVLLGHLGWKPGQQLSEYAGAATTFWFGRTNGKLPSGATPMRLPLRNLARFIVRYAPHTKLGIDRKTVEEIAREYRV